PAGSHLEVANRWQAFRQDREIALAAEKNRSGDGIAHGGGIENDRAQQGIRRGPSGSWVENMPVRLAVNLEEFPPNSRHRQRFVAKLQHGEEAAGALFRLGIFDRDFPAV